MSRAYSAALAVLLTASAAFAQQQAALVVVGEPAVIGVDADSAATFGELLRSELSRKGFRVVARSQTPPQPCGDSACAFDLMRVTSANGAIVLTLSKLGDKVIVRYEYVAANGQVLVSDHATAASIGDLEPVGARVAVSAATGRPFNETMGVSTVTETDAKVQARRRSMFTKFFHFGTLVPVASYAGSGTMIDLGFGGLWEFGGFAVDASMEFAWTLNPKEEQPSAFNWQLNFGGRYFFDPEADTGVYAGGGVGLRHVRVDERRTLTEETDSKWGFGVYAGVGVVFLRTADIHLLVDARYDVNVLSLQTSDGNTTAHGLMLTFGLAFTKLWIF